MIPYILLIVACVAVDQAVKFLVRANIPLFGSVDFLPGVMDLTYVQNTGAAFSIFEDHTWVLAILSAIIAAGLIVLLFKNVFSHPFGRTTLALVIGGAIGNLIDRVAFGFVTDMFRTLFMNFAVFNVADICVVVGGILFTIYFLFFYEKLEHKKEGAPHDDVHQDS